MNDIPAHLKDKEWYAFVSLELPEDTFSENYQYTFQTAEKAMNIESDVKVECRRAGQHFSDCFISHKEINIQNEVLKISLKFLRAVKGAIKIDIFGVQPVKLN